MTNRVGENREISKKTDRRVRLTVRTEPSQGLNTGSIPVRATKHQPMYHHRLGCFKYRTKIRILPLRRTGIPLSATKQKRRVMRRFCYTILFAQSKLFSLITQLSQLLPSDHRAALDPPQIQQFHQ